MSGHMEKAVTGNSQHGFIKDKSCLTNPIIFYGKMTGFVNEGSVVDVIYL